MLKHGLFFKPVSMQSESTKTIYSEAIGSAHGNILHNDDNPPELRLDIIWI